MTKNYKAFASRRCEKYTIGNVIRENMIDISDYIFDHYFWDTLEDAQHAAEIYNAYDGTEWLAQFARNREKVLYEDDLDCCSENEIELYELFNLEIKKPIENE